MPRLDKVLLVLGLTQTCFEGSMYLFVFLWVPSLQEATRSLDVLPLGYIFSAFMISMMLGSLLYTAITSYLLTTKPSGSSTNENSLVLHAKLSSLVCAASGLALAASVSSSDEKVRFWCFCAFEACVGMYYPVQGMLRGTLISNEHRATVSPFVCSRCPLLTFSAFLALIIIPCPSEHLCRRIARYWCLLCPTCGLSDKFRHAGLLCHYDRARYSKVC